MNNYKKYPQYPCMRYEHSYYFKPQNNQDGHYTLTIYPENLNNNHNLIPTPHKSVTTNYNNESHIVTMNYDDYKRKINMYYN